jgi:hypothetical protein
MTEQHTIYLGREQITALNKLGLLDGEHALTITMGDLMTGGDHAGKLAVSLTGEFQGGDHVLIDREGSISGSGALAARAER